jgi:hypothetical protein
MWHRLRDRIAESRRISSQKCYSPSRDYFVFHFACGCDDFSGWEFDHQDYRPKRAKPIALFLDHDEVGIFEFRDGVASILLAIIFSNRT